LLQIMPYLFKGISRTAPEFQAWRWAFFVPGAMHVLVAIVILAFGQVLHLPRLCTADRARMLDIHITADSHML
jgi:hypothetical protein